MLVGMLVLNRMEEYFVQQQTADLENRSQTIAGLIQDLYDANLQPLVLEDLTLHPTIARDLDGRMQFIADELAAANVRIRVGLDDGGTFVQARGADFAAMYLGEPQPGQTQESITHTEDYTLDAGLFPYAIQVTLSDPFTFRATAVANMTGLLVAIGLFALGMSMIVAAVLARRFTTPLRRLSEATRGIAEGDLTRRVPVDQVTSAPAELYELARQFNTMAERLQESVTIIRRDRDRSRDFLADVSHELRTPIAALRTFNELLREDAADDPAARAEFLQSSGEQIERLDWLAQNLLELSKLDSGLVLLDLRPEDLRATIESSVEQADPTARRRGIDLRVTLPDSPLRIRHDPQRIGQVITNLLGNAIKFTSRGGDVEIQARPHALGAEIEVRDTGVGIDATELPRIFDRFFRGSLANEARGSGSGLGLAIVRSIVDMHGGSVTVESSLGRGSRFVVVLPRDPRAADGPGPTSTAAAGEPSSASDDPSAADRKVADSSPSEGPRLNPGTAP
jgi:two-component system, OmpR family, sensor histidine kinase MtrB